MKVNLDKKLNIKVYAVIGAGVILFSVFLLYIVIMTGVQIPENSDGK